MIHAGTYMNSGLFLGLSRSPCQEPDLALCVLPVLVTWLADGFEGGGAMDLRV